MSYTWKDALKDIGKKLNDRIDFSKSELNDVINLSNTNLENKIISNKSELESKINKNNDEFINDVNGLNVNIQKLKETANINRKFTPTFGSFMDTFPSGLRIKTTDEIKNRLDCFKDIGIEEWVVQPWIVYNKDTGNLECNYNTSEMEKQIIYAKSIGIIPSVLKIHLYNVPYSLITDTITIDKFKTQYKEIVLNLSNALKNLNIEYCIVFNENEGIYTNSEWDSYVLDIINSVKKLGYKVGISTMGISNTLLMSDAILEEVDAFFGNTYPCISNKLDKTSFNDSVNCWNNDSSVSIFKYLKDRYQKPVILSEVGIMDYWACLDDPGQWKWSDDDKISSNGKTVSIVLYGLFNSDIKNIADKVWWCYDNLVGNDTAKTLLNNYIGVSLK